MTRIGLQALAVVAMLGASVPATAGYSWSFLAPNCSVAGGDGVGSSCAESASGTKPAVTATSYANTNGSGSDTSQYLLQGGFMSVYTGGIGEKNKDACGLSGSLANCDVNEGVAPEHALDNDQRYDSVLLSFGSTVALSSLTIGWKGGDSDMTVLAYTGSGTPSALTTKKYSDLTSSGWSLVGHYSNVAVNSLVGINAGAVSSSYWLIGAFNPLVGSVPAWKDASMDAIKLSAVGASDTKKVPEPASLALIGVALAAGSYARRRRI